MLDLYEALLTPRIIEERMLVALRQGHISKWFSGIGQEAISVGCVAALEPHDYILPLHRNLGVFTGRQVSLERLFCQWLGKPNGFTKGRDRSFHFGSKEHHLIGMISHLGVQLTVANGLALGHRLKQQERVVLAFTGEGGTSEGDFHEALNVASVWRLPVIFLIENNGYALSTATDQQYACSALKERAVGYGMEGVSLDGNDVLAVRQTISELGHSLREDPRPVLVEALTFRMRGHEEASGTRYVPAEKLAEWGQRDPVARFEQQLLDDGYADNDLQAVRERVRESVESAWDKALAAPRPVYRRSAEAEDVFCTTVSAPIAPQPVEAGARELRLVDALNEAHFEAMRQHSNLVVMGQDVADYGGVFKVTEGLLEEFGPERVRNTPLCESAIVGAAVGLSIAGFKSIVEMQFSDFASCAFNQLVNKVAKLHYRWGQNVDLVVRMPTGGSVGAGPFHSQSLEAYFCHVPGLKVVYPAFPAEAKGLLLACLEDPNPVLFFEHKALYRKSRFPVPAGYYTGELGKARVLREGRDITLVTYGLGVHWALEVLERHPRLSVTLIDLQTLSPWDKELVREWVCRTGKALVLHEDTLAGGFGAEVAADLGQHCFEYLDAPIVRCASQDTPVPFARELEDGFLALADLEQSLLELDRY